MALFARLAVFVFTRSLVPRTNEMRIAVAAASATAARGEKSLTGLGEIDQLLAGVRVEDHGADRNPENCGFTGATVAFRALAVAAALGAKLAIVAIQ